MIIFLLFYSLSAILFQSQQEHHQQNAFFVHLYDSPEIFYTRINQSQTFSNYTPPSTYTKPFVPRELNDCSYVWLKQPFKKTSLDRPYLGPFKVLKRQGTVYTIDYNGQNYNVSIDRLKPNITFDDLKITKKLGFSPDSKSF